MTSRHAGANLESRRQRRSHELRSELQQRVPATPLKGISMDTTLSHKVRLRSQIGHFLMHYGEMCAPMCIGFAVGDLVYFWAAGVFGYSHPFRELPELSVLVVTFTMSAPMTAWMLFRRMPQRATVEMSAALPILAVVLLSFGWLAIVPRADLALLEHGLMMPVMLVPMLARLDLYTGRAGHPAHDMHAAHH